MQSALLPSPYRNQELKRKQSALEYRLRFTLNAENLYSKINHDNALGQDLSGMGIIFIDNEFTAVTLLESCRAKPAYLILREPPLQVPVEHYAKALQSNERESKHIQEITATVISCSVMALNWLAIVSMGTAIPLTGGLSAAGIALLKTGAVISSLQCANGGYRTYKEFSDPAGLDMMDNKDWYKYSTLALDTISVGLAVQSGASLIKNYHHLKKASGINPDKFLHSLNRHERKRLTLEIVKLNHPALAHSNGALKRMINANMYPKRYQQIQINDALRVRIKDAVAGVLTFGGSATSGSIKYLAVGVYAATDTEQ